MECVTTASASVLVSGSPSGDFKLERGLSQRDPLSPFLFIIDIEGLTLFVRKAIEVGIYGEAEVGKEKLAFPTFNTRTTLCLHVHGSGKMSEQSKTCREFLRFYPGLR